MRQIAFSRAVAASLLTALAAVSLAPPVSGAPNPDTPLRVHVERHRLANGMTFLLVPETATPIVYSFLYVDVGSVDEEPGITGTSHVLEHMMFKGTTEIGTTDLAAETRIMARVDSTMADAFRLRDRDLRGLGGADTGALAELRARADSLELAARGVTVQNDLDVVTSKLGFSGLNAFTSEDQTVYFESFPPNLFEVWAWFESARIAHPVFREFYSERDVVMEERRRSYDTDPDGALYTALIATAYAAHPYRWSAIGWQSDLERLERKEVRRYFEEHYAPNHLTMVVVGNLDPARVMELAERYFGPIPPSGPAHVVTTVEPPQTGPKRVEVEFDATPRLSMGFHTGALTDSDRVVVEVIDGLLTGGRTSRLYRSLVLDRKLAAGVSSGIRGDKYPGLFMVDTAPLEPGKLDSLRTALEAELARMATAPPTDRELDKVKIQLEADLMRSLQNPTRLALNLASYEVLTGSWENLEKAYRARMAVTPEDVRRVARALFDPRNRTVAELQPAGAPAEVAR